MPKKAPKEWDMPANAMSPVSERAYNAKRCSFCSTGKALYRWGKKVACKVCKPKLEPIVLKSRDRFEAIEAKFERDPIESSGSYVNGQYRDTDAPWWDQV